MHGANPAASAKWRVKSAFGWKSAMTALLALLALGASAERMQFGELAGQLGEVVQSALGLRESSQIGRSLGRIADDMFPIAIAERRPIDRIEGFDPEHLPPFSRLETVTAETTAIDPETLEIGTGQMQTTYLVEPAGYLLFTLGRMLETIEIALWGTILAVLISAPLAYLCARKYSPSRAAYLATRALVSLLRAIPEIVSALFLVLAFGFGPVPGILALALHGAGFLAKFYAEDIEAADKRAPEALLAIGASSFTILRLAVLPQVMPGFLALTLYILDRNVRMAAVIGLVGAGGIGQELKGRFDLFQYSHVGTILFVIFATVLAIDLIAAQLRSRLI